MSGSTEEFKHEVLQDPASIVSYLRALADGLASGSLQFRCGEQEFSVAPKGLVRFSLKGKREGRRVRISTRLSWKDRDEEAEKSKESRSAPLLIGAENSSG